MKETIIPYNVIIDVQVEYEVINPLVIYDEYGFKEGEEAYTSYVNNVVQEIISEIIFEYGIDLDYIKLDSGLKNKTIHTIRKRLKEEEIRKYDNPYCSINKKSDNELNELNAKDCISISNIVITSFDKNIAFRFAKNAPNRFIIKLNVPKNHPAVYMENLTSGDVKLFGGEEEINVIKNSEMIIKNLKKGVNPLNNKEIYEIEGDVIGFKDVKSKQREVVLDEDVIEFRKMLLKNMM
jgi:hypothetical protein